MDNIRLFLVIALVFISLLLYQAWQIDYGKKPSTTTDTTVTSEVSTPSTTTIAELPSTTSGEPPLAESSSRINAEFPESQPQRVLNSANRIQVETDLFRLEIDTQGGDIRRVDLLAYPIKANTPEKSFRLMNDELPNVFIAQSGLQPAPTHEDVYHSAQSSYRLGSDDTLNVELTWQDTPTGISVKKIYTFQRGSYLIAVKHLVENKGQNPWQARVYGILQRTHVAESGQSSFVYTYMGGAISSPKSRYEKIKFTNMQDGDFNGEKREGWAHGWAAMLQHYFLGAWIPVPDEVFHYYTRVLPKGQRYVLGLYGQFVEIAPNSQHTFNLSFYAGPKVQDELAKIAPNLDLTVDYGWLWFIAQPLFWLLEHIHTLTGNWGWAIIILTLLIKLAFFHLSATSYKSMANMRRIHPRLMALKERYGDDKARLNQAMMELYKKEKINPLGGCLPILVQIPVFISLYWVLLESVELRQAHFMFWLDDLSTPDPYFVLPLIMAATMFLQHKLNPAPIDPIQQKVMMMLPFIFGVFFAFFPSGLVLYWVVNNVLSITQQWIITKKIVGDSVVLRSKD